MKRSSWLTFMFLAAIVSVALVWSACAPAAPTPAPPPAKAEQPAPPAPPAAPAGEQPKPTVAQAQPTVAQPAPAQPAAKSEKSRTLTIAIGADPPTLDPAFSQDIPTSSIIEWVYDKMVKRRDDYKGIELDLATSWKVSDDGKTWTFKLRPGAKFSNGDSLTAADVKFSLERILDPKNASPWRGTFTAIKEIVAVDDTELRIVTSEPFPDLIASLADWTGSIVNQKVVKQYETKQVGLHPVGSGPYKLKEWVPGERIVFERNPLYWGKQPFFDQVVFRPVLEAGSRLSMLLAGAADVAMDPPLEESLRLKNNPAVTINTVDGVLYLGIEMMTDRPPFSDRRVRQAMNYAVDRKSIINDLLGGYGIVNNSPMSPGAGEYQVQFTPYDLNPAKAKQLLAEAGYPNGFSFELRYPTGRWNKTTEVMEAVQSYLAAVGVKATLRTYDWATFTKIGEDKNRQAWLLGRATGNTDFMFTRLFAKEMWDTGVNNLTRFSDDRVEELLKKARYEMDVEKRKAVYRQIQEIVWDAPTNIYLYVERFNFLTRSDVKGVVVMPTGTMRVADARRE